MSIVRHFGIREEGVSTAASGEVPEKVFLIRAEFKHRLRPDGAEAMTELANLVQTAGGEVVGESVQKLQRPVSETYIGKGKAEQLAEECRDRQIDTVVFYDELTPGQGRNLERVFDCKIIDRTTLILDIFAQRARSREGKLQVELAQLRHLLPRLTRFWTHLSRQKGGIGMRGEGETQLETDRRRVQQRIKRLVTELERVRQHRSVQRQGRRRRNWPLASIVGYTNAGKTTLQRWLTGAAALGEDKLFATLDPSTRLLKLDTNQRILLSDTVGFIRELPHQLIEAFKATLEEVVESDLILHVADLSDPQVEFQIAEVDRILEQLGVNDKPTLTVFNKIDRLASPDRLERFLERYDGAVGVSAANGTGMARLEANLSRRLRPVRLHLKLSVPLERSAVIARIHEVGQVVKLKYRANRAWIEAHVPPRCFSEFGEFVVPGSETPERPFEDLPCNFR